MDTLQENIRNMYEPILDLSLEHLIALYKKVKALKA